MALTSVMRTAASAVASASVAVASVSRRSASTVCLSQLVTTPSKVAQALDWRMASGSLLSVVVQKDSLQIAVASHPAFHEETKELPSIPLYPSSNIGSSSSSSKTPGVAATAATSTSVTERLQHIVGQYNVCGLVVSWPVQHDGWVGASCGRVLHALDHIPVTSASMNRPVCLYDASHTPLPHVDEWGRCALYSTVVGSSSTQSVSSLRTEPTPPLPHAAALVCREFMQDHWPELVMAMSSSSSGAGTHRHAALVTRSAPSSRSPQPEQERQSLVTDKRDGARQMAFF